jgi:flagellar protein FlaI
MSEVVLRPGKKPPRIIQPSGERRSETAPRIIRTLSERGSGAVSIDDAIRRFDPSSVEKALAKLLLRGRRMRPGFSSAWVGLDPPEGMLLTKYRVEGASVTLFRHGETGEPFYHCVPDEYKLPEYQLKLLDHSRRFLAISVESSTVLPVGTAGRDHARGAAEEAVARAIKARGGLPGASTGEEAAVTAKLADVLTRYTLGLGVLEAVLSDPHVQDVYVDSPADRCAVHVALGPTLVDVGAGKCETNIVLTEREATSVLARLRLQSGRPFSEAMPVLETDLEEFKTRVTVVGRPLSPTGVAMALRRHSTDPWTLTKFVKNRTLTPLAAGLLWLLVDGRSTVLVAGSRGAGKSSMLSAMILEFPQSQRILTIEDTLELPTHEMQRLGYKVQSLFVRSTLGGTEEMTADDALRVSLRLGESAIVLGEVRGRETRTLYEAMRSGSAGSAVLGTIHGNSPRSVFERIVYDLGIPAKAFNATDVVVVCGLVRPGGGQRQVRRVTTIAEVAKRDEQEGQFRDLLVYDEAKDTLVETPHLRQGSERLAAIAGQWGLSRDELLQNLEARAKLKHTLVEASAKGGEALLSAKWNMLANAYFWQLVGSATGEPDYERLYAKWRQWFDARSGL